MIEQIIHGQKYDIVVGNDLSERIKGVISAPDTFLITDSNVEKLYGAEFARARYVLPAGEDSKRLVNVGKICDAMLASGCNRAATVIALGGGVVGDIAGFAASVYMRGVKVIQIPTTLLAMCDSSIGGKTGVNANAKNIIGAFHQPSAVITSMHFLKTLPRREMLCGMGEIFKTALLDARLYAVFKDLIRELKTDGKGLIIEPDGLTDIVRLCAAYKLDVVTKDEREAGLRKILNVGHTLGHALEVYDKYRLSHGEYVIQGIGLEAAIAKDIGLVDSGHFNETQEYCRVLGSGETPRFDPEKLAHLCEFDKKNKSGGVSIMLSLAPGKTEEILLKPEELVKTLKRIKTGHK